MPTTARPGLRAWLYARASVDPKKRGRSTGDQMTENRRVCAANSWSVIQEFVDKDRSASRHAKRPREDFDRLVREIPTGAGDIIVSWESSRMQRDLETYVMLRSLCMKHKVLWCYNGTVYDMADKSDRMITAMMAMQAESEADDIQARNVRTARLNGERGGVHGKLPFGYTRRYSTLDGTLIGQFRHPEHAEVVIELFQRADRKQSLTSMLPILQAHRPNANTASLRKILGNKTYLGLRTHHDEVVQGLWEPISPEPWFEPLFYRVQAMLADPARRRVRDTRALHLLSGIAECGVCTPAEAAIGLAPSSNINSGTYRCRNGTHVTMQYNRLEAYVEEALFAWLKKPESRRAFQPPDNSEVESVKQRLQSVRTQLNEARQLAQSFDPVTYEPKLSVASLASMEARLGPLAAELAHKLQALMATGDPIIDKLIGADPELVEQAWEDLTIPQRRHVVRKMVRVTLNRATVRGARTIEPGRIDLLFASEPGFTPKLRWGRPDL